jgi:uncharacterized protein
VPRGGRIAAAALLIAAAFPALAERAVPALTGPVVDEAGVLDSRWRGELDALCRAAWALPAGRRVQLQYLLLASLDGDAIDPYAVRVFEAWKLGERGKDNGVLVVVAVKDHRVRIETGYGAEGALTDAQAGRIIRGTIAPAFREGRYGEGLYAAGRQILAALGALPEGVAQGDRARPREIPIPLLGPLIGFLLALGSPFLFLLLIAFFVLRLLFGGPRRWGGGGWGGGGWGGGGWSGGGGGGWSGGGGGSGGGGASGSW